MKYNRAWAIEAVKQGTPITIFYGHTPKSEKVDISCMSQWFPCRFPVDGWREIWPSSLKTPL